MRQIDLFQMEKIRTKDQPLKFFGVEMGARMTVVPCDNDNIFVHSPIKLSDSDVAELNQLGQVKWVVAPNKWHHLYVQDSKNHFPSAEFYCAPGLDKKRPDFKFTEVISNEQKFPWNPELAHVLIDGVPMYNEVVFFHQKTKTLIVTDLAVHIRHSKSFFTKLCLTLMGAYGNFGWSAIEKFMFIRDKRAFRCSIERVLEFDFERVIMAHGDIVENDGKRLFSAAFS